MYLVAIDCTNCSWAHKVRILTIHSFQLHTNLKVILLWGWWLLKKNVHLS
jgi:hypothetical protein